ncbi:MAG TPA: ABC transporter ATP-binding protein [Bacteroidales bacterium]|nr:ABC transporter ATP-binding protein [Bacteroidales bacterium]
MLTIDRITKTFPLRGMVLDELSLVVSPGDLISVMGPSGSGKTTLLNIAGLLDKPDKGSVLFQGKDISALNDNESADYRNKNIGFVFQEHMLLPQLTVYENILLPLLASGRMKKESSKEHLEILMEKTGISDISLKYPHQISGGEAQRTALLRALVNKPSIILADEPTGSLDTMNAGILGNLLIEINNTLGTTIILATHSEELAGKMHRRFRLESGKLVQL